MPGLFCLAAPLITAHCHRESGVIQYSGPLDLLLQHSLLLDALLA
jgi:hypothetical protein